MGRTDAKAEAPILWPPDVKNQLTGKEPATRKSWRQEEKGTTEDEMVGWHHRLNGHEFEQAPGDGEGQGSLVCCSPWGHQQSDMTERLNNQKGWFTIWSIRLWSETSLISLQAPQGHFGPWTRVQEARWSDLGSYSNTFESHRGL